MARLERAVGAMVAGATVVAGTGAFDVPPADWDAFREVSFLAQHGTWTWTSLQDAPEDVVMAVMRFQALRGAEARRRA